jgi:putative transferase (TIGR04331 family)
LENNKKLVITCGQKLRTNKYKIVSLFPQEINDESHRVLYDEFKKRNIILSKFYRSVISHSSSKMSLINGYTKNNYEIFLRPVLVNITSVYIDRAIRLLKIIKKSKNIPTILQSKSKNNYFRNDCLANDLNENEELNLKIIEFIGASLGLATLDIKRLDKAVSMSQKNLMFTPQHKVIKQLFIRFYNSLLIRFKRLSNKAATIYTHNLFADNYWLISTGFYGPFGIFRDISKINLVESKINNDYRENLKNNLSQILEDNFLNLIAELSEISLTKKESKNLSDNYINFLFKFFPSNLLEGIPKNLKIIEKIFPKNNQLYLLCNSPTLDESYFLAALIKERKGIVIGAQHGGHLGYIDDMTIFSEREFALCDYYITSGWSNFNKNYPISKPIVLPSPRLSYMSKNNLFKFKKINKKILFMPNLYRKFTLGACGQVGSDYLDLINNHYIELAKKLNFENYEMHIKPYNEESYELLKPIFNKMESLSNKKIKISKIKQKGLSPKIINSFDLIIWDQIGSGAIDCFVTKIPCLIYWNKIYSFESHEGKNTIKQLVNAKIIHNTSSSLNHEIINYYSDPLKWIKNPKRLNAINNFNKVFALTSNKWNDEWRKFFNNLTANG